MQILREAFPEHALLGEEGGVVEGDPGSDWLWCIDPLDGTTNFAHGYPSFATSIGASHLRNLRTDGRLANPNVDFRAAPGHVLM